MADNQGQIPSYEEGYQVGDINRATQMRRDNDTVKTPKVTLYDIDYSVLYHLSQKIKLKINEGDRVIDVPVIFADGERWAQIKSRGHLRDANNRIMAPLIAIRRTDVSDDERLPMLDLNNLAPYRKFYPFKTMNMQHDKLTGQVLRKPSYEFYMIESPNYVRVTYEAIICTNMITQMNTILQAILATSNHLWGDYYSFRTVVTSPRMNNTNNVGEDRLVSTNMTLVVDGWLREEFEYHEPTMQKAYTIKKVRFENEREELDFYIDEPYLFHTTEHISQEPKHIQAMNKTRNIRYR